MAVVIRSRTGETYVQHRVRTRGGNVRFVNVPVGAGHVVTTKSGKKVVRQRLSKGVFRETPLEPDPKTRDVTSNIITTSAAKVEGGTTKKKVVKRSGRTKQTLYTVTGGKPVTPTETGFQDVQVYQKQYKSGRFSSLRRVVTTDTGEVHPTARVFNVKERVTREPSLEYASPTRQPGISGFESRIRESQGRKSAFEQGVRNSPGFQRVSAFANLITQNPISYAIRGETPYEQRSTFGKALSQTATGAMTWPFFLGAGVSMAGEKIAATGEGIATRETRMNIVPELKRAGKETSTYFDPTTAQGQATYMSAGLFALGGLNPTNVLTRNVMKTSSKYVAPQKTGLTYVEGHTQPQNLRTLSSLGGKTVRTTHVTVANLPKVKGNIDFVATGGPGPAGGFRQSYQLYSFYKAAPRAGSVRTVPVRGYKTSSTLLQLRKQDPLLTEYSLGFSIGKGRTVSSHQRTLSEPQAYLGYGGLGKPESSGSVIIGKKPINILMFRDTVSKTGLNMRGQNPTEINVRQLGESGATHIAPENIARMSVEGQLTTPAKYVDSQGQPLAGYEQYPGSRIVQTGETKFTYYKQTIEPPENPIGKVLFNLFGKKTEYYKLNMIPAKTKAVQGEISTQNVPSLDIKSYAEKYSVPKRTVTSPSEISASKARSSTTSSIIGRSSLTSSSRSRSSGISSSSVSRSYSLSRGSYSIGSYSGSILRSSGRPSRTPSRSKSRSRSRSYSSSIVTSYTSSSPGTSYTPSKTPGTRTFNTPSIKFNLKPQAKKTKRKGKEMFTAFNPKYFPSVEASLFKIKGKRPSKLATSSGLVLRPII